MASETLALWMGALSSLHSRPPFPHGSTKGLDESLWKALWSSSRPRKALQDPRSSPSVAGSTFPWFHLGQVGLGPHLWAPCMVMVLILPWWERLEGSVTVGSTEVDSVALWVRACSSSC